MTRLGRNRIKPILDDSDIITSEVSILGKSLNESIQICNDEQLDWPVCNAYFLSDYQISQKEKFMLLNDEMLSDN